MLHSNRINMKLFTFFIYFHKKDFKHGNRQGFWDNKDLSLPIFGHWGTELMISQPNVPH